MKFSIVFNLRWLSILAINTSVYIVVMFLCYVALDIIGRPNPSTLSITLPFHIAFVLWLTQRAYRRMSND